ncbi:MAG: NAD-dependent epimerase/dehydratase family protein [bacterium]
MPFASKERISINEMVCEKEGLFMQVLVTGGAGFIGSHAAEACIEAGYEVVVVDSLVRGKIENVPDKATLFKLDIATDSSSELQEIITNFGVKVVIHQAAQVDVSVSMLRPALDASVNILGLINVLEACRNTGVQKIIYASSAAIYGEPMSLPIKEEHTISPTSPYGLSKYIGERYLVLYRQLFGLDYTILRYSNVYGPRQDASGDGGVVAIFAHKLLEDINPIIYGSGEQTRDFIFVEDVARANVLAVVRGGHVLNISSGKQTSINELYFSITRILGSSVSPHYYPARPGDIEASCLDNSRAREVLGWEPKYSLLDGLNEYTNLLKSR